MKKFDPDRKKAVSNFMLDIAKLTFASFILGGILLGELPQYILIGVGTFISAVCAFTGVLLAKKE